MIYKALQYFKIQFRSQSHLIPVWQNRAHSYNASISPGEILPLSWFSRDCLALFRFRKSISSTGIQNQMTWNLPVGVCSRDKYTNHDNYSQKSARVSHFRAIPNSTTFPHKFKSVLNCLGRSFRPGILHVSVLRKTQTVNLLFYLVITYGNMQPSVCSSFLSEVTFHRNRPCLNGPRWILVLRISSKKPDYKS